ncbi:MAG: SpoIIE family protein phosphatase [Calditrichota bacterium]
MQNNITDDVKKILLYYRKLFNYQSLYLFPKVNTKTISPIVNIGVEDKKPFEHQQKIGWLNYFQNVLTHQNIDEHLSVGEFFKYYELDILYPIRLNSTCYGFLGIGSNGRDINRIELQIGELIVNYLASFWRNLELLKGAKTDSQKTESLVEEIANLLEISHAIESGENLQVLLEFIMKRSMKIMRAEAASLLLLDENQKELEFRVALGPKGREVKPHRLPLGQGIGGWVAKNRKPLLIPDVKQDDRFDPTFDQRSGYATRSIVCVPLIRNSRTLGVMQALNRTDGKPFTEEDVTTFSIISTLAALAIENSKLVYSAIEKEKMDKDLAVASEIQRLIIPKHLPKVIGGDFYSVFPLNENETVFCIADATGKGISGALLVSTLHATLKAYLDFTNDLVLILTKLNHLIDELSTSDKYITLFIALYDKQTSDLTYINAGHNPPILFTKKDKYEKLKKGGVCIGIIPFDYQTETVRLNKGDLLLMYTDGVTDAMDDKKERFGESNLIDVLSEKRGQNCEAIQDEISLRVLDHCGDQPLNDDFTLFIIKRK